MAARSESQRWEKATSARLLLVDPWAEEHVVVGLAERGIEVTRVGSTLDGLVEFGRTNPGVVAVAADARGIPATDFVFKVREFAAPFVIAVLSSYKAPEAGPLLLAGAQAAVARPYGSDALCEVLDRSTIALDDQGRLRFGRIVLDSRAYLVLVDDRRLGELPLKEFELLRALMSRAPEVVSNEEIRLALWGSPHDGPADNTISVHVGRLRTRLDGIAHIRRIRGRGYSLTLS